jgi:hypothetical protein
MIYFSTFTTVQIEIPFPDLATKIDVDAWEEKRRQGICGHGNNGIYKSTPPKRIGIRLETPIDD